MVRKITRHIRSKRRRKRKGLAVVIMVLFSCFLVSGISTSLAKLYSSGSRMIASGNASLQAKHFAQQKMNYLVFKGYDNLASQNKTSILGSPFCDSVELSPVATDAEGLSRRLVTVKVYNGDESLPRASVSQVFYSNDMNIHVRNLNSPTNDIGLKYEDGKMSAEVDGASVNLGGSVPIGTIIAYAGSSAPTEGGTWLLCNGQSCSAYPALVAIIGSNVPNLEGRFLEGTTGAPRSYKDAGLPNITGYFTTGSWTSHTYELSGAFYNNDGSSGVGGNKGDGRLRAYFDASRSSSVYGKSSTVQPPSYVVRYYIKAA